MKLKGRLLAVAEKIPKCDLLTDIGTDHAYIPVYTLKNNICKRAIAADVKKGPVEIAEKNIRKYELQDVIDTRLGYGLDPIMEAESDVIVIAGMGGILIKEIMERGMEKAKMAKLLVLQPMNNIEVLRKWLYKNGFDIVEESLAEETDKIYNIICTKWIGISKEVDDFFCYIGLKFADRKDDLFARYLQRKLRLIETMINGMKMAEKEAPELGNLISIRKRLVSMLECIR